MYTNSMRSLDGAYPGPSVSDQGYNTGADPGLVLYGDQGHNLGAGPGPRLSGDQGRDDNNSSRRVKLGKTNIKTATWNVRTMQQCGKPELVAAALQHYKVDVACLQEVRFPASGSFSVLAAGTDEVFKVYHSGSENGQYGVAVAVSSRLSSAVTDFKVISDRICYITIRAEPVNVTIVSAYAPTNDHDLLSRQAFFDTLQTVVSGIPKRDFLLLGMDANAKLGQGLPTSRHVGPFATGTQCGNGGLLRDFSASQNLAVANTFFQHKLSHKVSWSSATGKVRNEIDFMLVRCRWRSSVQNTRAYWGACSFASSDHALVCSVLHLRLRIQKQKSSAVKFNTAMLKLPHVANRFRQTVDEKLATSQPQAAIDSESERINKALVEAGKETLAKCRNKLDPWVSQTGKRTGRT
jgi:hypothetical protein